MDDTPNPGSDEAAALGCACPRVDNGYGAGLYYAGGKYGFVINGECPLHGHQMPEGGEE